MKKLVLGLGILVLSVSSFASDDSQLITTLGEDIIEYSPLIEAAQNWDKQQCETAGQSLLLTVAFMKAGAACDELHLNRWECDAAIVRTSGSIAQEVCTTLCTKHVLKNCR